MAMTSSTRQQVSAELQTKQGAPGAAASAVTQHNSTADPSGPFRFLKVLASGDISYVDLEGNTVAEAGLVAGDYVWCGVVRVNDTGTTIADASIIGYR